MSVTFDFSARTVVVTGAAQGIGHGIARLFLGAGARVAAVDRDADRLAAAFAADDRALLVPADVSVATDVDAAVARVVEETGRVDVLVNNAGITRDGVVWKLTDEMWESVLAVHLTGTFRMTRACLPTMRAQQGGRIVNVTSYTGLHGNIGQANYAAAKGGIVSFTKTVAKEVARFGITVNAISPNAETPMVAGIPDDRKAELTRQVPLGRFGDPEEMAPAVAFLASDEARYITGAVLPVDGGLSM